MKIGVEWGPLLFWEPVEALLRARGHTFRRGRQLEGWSDLVWNDWLSGQHIVDYTRRPKRARLMFRGHGGDVRDGKQWHDAMDRTRIDGIVFGSEALRKIWRDRYGDVCHTWAIPPGYDDSKFRFVKRTRRPRLIGMLGYLRELKGHVKFIRHVFAPLLRQDPGWIFEIKGSENLDGRRASVRTHIERVATELGVRDNIVFRQHGDPTRFLSRMDVIVSWSEAEGGHRAIQEGMGMGCLGLVRDWPSLSNARELYGRWVVEDSDDAIYRLICYGQMSESELWLAQRAAAEQVRPCRFSVTGPRIVKVIETIGRI